MIDAFRLAVTQIALDRVPVDWVHGDQPVWATQHTLAAVNTFFRIDLNGAGFSVPLDQIFRTGTDAISAL
jgi:hypothetical protein